jgi:hypothetical protein
MKDWEIVGNPSLGIRGFFGGLIPELLCKIQKFFFLFVELDIGKFF